MKAWVGFTFYAEDSQGLQYPGIATGNWGCGAFGGSPGLKALLQLMAAAEARRPLAYYTFQDTKLRDEIINVYNLLARHNVTVGECVAAGKATLALSNVIAELLLKMCPVNRRRARTA